MTKVSFKDTMTIPWGIILEINCVTLARKKLPGTLPTYVCPLQRKGDYAESPWLESLLLIGLVVATGYKLIDLDT